MKDKVIRKSRKKIGGRMIVPYRIRVILPIIFGLQGTTSQTPEELLRDAAILFSAKDPWRVLGSIERRALKKYLKKWNITDFTE